MKPFLKRVLRFLLLPIIVIVLLIVGYFIFDPLRVLYPHDTYTHTHANRDFYSIETFNKRYPQQKYNSFIFGSSRTLGYSPTSWKKYLGEGSTPFMLDGYGDNIYGIYHKIKYLDSLNVDIQNTLVILDADATFANTKPLKGFLYTKHPLISGESMLSFQLEQFMAYFNLNMALRYYVYRLGGVKNDFVYSYLNNMRASVDSISNELRLTVFDKQIEENPEKFFSRRVFYERPEKPVINGCQIKDEQYRMLTEIIGIFRKHDTDYKIIIGPDYDQRKYCEEDMNILYKLFGKDNVYDFSGKNEITESKFNYYENSHYRPHVGDSIMKYIYNKHN